jgi:hypothetical protein
MMFPLLVLVVIYPLKDRVRYEYKDIGCWMGVVEAYGITNGSSQGVEPQDDPLVLSRCFPAKFTTLIGRKMPITYPPHLSSDGKKAQKRGSLRLDGV